jgi:heme/copper-type cytochrome/quinol oxidase subunit 2
MKPRINTSYRSHGKWGDFLACVIPTIWCVNILVNSNFILRLVEWQNESSLFTVRIRGRQWYWVYKFELRNIIDLMSVPKNAGWNKWIIQNGNSFQTADDYFFALKLRSQNSWLANYWKSYISSLKQTTNAHSIFFIDSYYFLSTNTENNLKKISIDFTPSIYEKINLKNYKFKNKINFFNAIESTSSNFLIESNFYGSSWKSTLTKNVNKELLNVLNKNLFLKKKNYKFFLNNIFLYLNDTSDEKVIEFINLEKKKVDNSDFSRFLKKNFFENKPILCIKNYIKIFFKNNGEANNFDKKNGIISLNFNSKKSIEKKIIPDNNFLTLKQKRYKRKKTIPIRYQFEVDNLDNLTKRIKHSDKPYLTSNQIIKNLDFEPTVLYRTMKKNKLRSETISVQLSRRLLRTKKTLVLPSHMNITLISNSYDVIHSWFLPALGIKIDCVPGRSTHHTFYCDSVGFYYGQCAEICGRYHHHMPIRLCIIPFEHFLVWWHHFGLPKLLFTESKFRHEVDYSIKKFIW